MKKPNVGQIVLKDIFDFVFIFALALLLTVGVYFASPVFEEVNLSLYFFEQFAELFFVNKNLFLWFIGLCLGVAWLYFLIGALALGSTLGGKIFGIAMVDKKTCEPISSLQASAMAIGSFIGALLFMVSPLYAWWINPSHRGLSQWLARVELVKGRGSSQQSA